MDHIFPKSLIDRRTLMGLNIPATRIDRIVEAADRIGNLELLTSADNMSKTNQPFEEWIVTRDRDFLARHLIPDDRGSLGRADATGVRRCPRGADPEEDDDIAGGRRRRPRCCIN